MRPSQKLYRLLANDSIAMVSPAAPAGTQRGSVSQTSEGEYIVDDDAPVELPMFGQLWCSAEPALGVVWLFGVVPLFGVVEPGDEAAMATAPHVPATATAAVAAAVSSMRFDFGNRSPFSGSRDGPYPSRW